MRHADDGFEGQLDLLEGFVTLKPSSSLAVDVGKKITKWGTGYFRNAVSFVDRPKDPDDSREALEGFLVLKADLIRSFDGPVKTVTFTPVVLPVTKDVNREFDDPDHLNFAARLYLLAWDTDVDVLFFTGGAAEPLATVWTSRGISKRTSRFTRSSHGSPTSRDDPSMS